MPFMFSLTLRLRSSNLIGLALLAALALNANDVANGQSSNLRTSSEPSTKAQQPNEQLFDSPPSKLSVMTWNVEWMFDHRKQGNSKLAAEQSAPSEEYWNWKLTSVAKVIAEEEPHIVALQEIEDGSTLGALRGVLKEMGQSYRYCFINGRDTFTGQDVGFLMKSGLVGYSRREQSKVMYDSNNYRNISKHLIGEFRWDEVERPLTIINVHFYARAEAEDRRVKQARLARQFLADSLEEGHDCILLGDTNSEHSPGTMVGDVKAIAENTPKMIDLLTQSDQPNLPTHLVLDKQFDRIYVSSSLMEDGPGKDWVFQSIRVVTDGVINGKRDGEEHWDERLTMSTDELDVSDHFPVIAEFELK